MPKNDAKKIKVCCSIQENDRKCNKMTRGEEMEGREKIIAEILELLKEADEEALRFIRSFLKAA